MGGDPDVGRSAGVIDAVLKGGADILEVGIPFSDPIADGPAVQAAGVRALASGTRPADVLEIASEVKKEHDTPVVLMTYYNPVYSRGVREFLGAAHRKGVDGIIIPDLPLEEAQTLGNLARAEGVDSVLLAAPTTSMDRMRRIVANTSGFLYLVSVLGVTGTREKVEERTVELVKSAKRFTAGRVPLGVGFGISKPEHVLRVMDAGADAAIVGSAIVERVKGYAAGEGGLDEITKFVSSMKAATRSGAKSLGSA